MCPLQVDSLQALLRGPSTLVCAGNEAFRPPALENAQKNKADSGRTSRNKNSEFVLGSRSDLHLVVAGRAGQQSIPGNLGNAPFGLSSQAFQSFGRRLLCLSPSSHNHHFNWVERLMGIGEDRVWYLKERNWETLSWKFLGSKITYRGTQWAGPQAAKGLACGEIHIL